MFLNYQNTLPFYDFGLESGWNPIEANLLGASTVFSGDTPINHIGYSLQAFQQAHQQTAGEWDKVIRDNQAIDPNNNPYIPHYPKNPDDSVNNPSLNNTGKVRRICSDANGNIVLTSREGEAGIRCTTSIDQSPGFFDELTKGTVTTSFGDFEKRILLVVAGIAIILVAIK